MLPGSVVGKITQGINNLWKAEAIWARGDVAAFVLVDQEQVASAAEYVSQMGYDLKGMGFLSTDSQKADGKFTKLTAKVQDRCMGSILAKCKPIKSK